MASEPSDSRVIATGTVEGLFAFLDFLVEKGYGPRSAVSPWKSAARQVFAAVEGDAYEGVDVRPIDPDEYMARFENMTVGQYKEESLASYRSRFKKALDAYTGYLDSRKIPSFRGTGGGRRTAGPATQPTPTRRSQPKELVQGTTPEPPLDDSLVTYPFPLQSGVMARLSLPQTLEKVDADRLSTFLQSLVLQPQRQIAAHSET